MKNLIIGAILVLIIVLTVNYCNDRNAEKESLEENTALIQKQLKNVGKLVVTEGNFSQVYTYKNSKSFYLDVLSAKKKALIVVNAKATVAYDLSKLDVEIDQENKRVVIKSIPKEEISINPDIEYYDVSQDYLNQFDAEDYNKIKQRIEQGLRQKIEKSTLKSNAQNRLISELQKIYILTNSMGWTLEYKNQKIESSEKLESIKI